MVDIYKHEIQMNDDLKLILNQRFGFDFDYDVLYAYTPKKDQLNLHIDNFVYITKAENQYELGLERDIFHSDELAPLEAKLIQWAIGENIWGKQDESVTVYKSEQLQGVTYNKESEVA
tara:strand:- start:187 stop:540 length:354 start_codon:yes stop_codon:yes gene_type:complete